MGDRYHSPLARQHPTGSAPGTRAPSAPAGDSNNLRVPGQPRDVASCRAAHTMGRGPPKSSSNSKTTTGCTRDRPQERPHLVPRALLYSKRVSEVSAPTSPDLGSLVRRCLQLECIPQNACCRPLLPQLAWCLQHGGRTLPWSRLTDIWDMRAPVKPHKSFLHIVPNRWEGASLQAEV